MYEVFTVVLKTRQEETQTRAAAQMLLDHKKLAPDKLRFMIYQMEGKKLHLQNQEVQFLPMCDILVILVKLQFVCK